MNDFIIYYFIIYYLCLCPNSAAPTHNVCQTARWRFTYLRLKVYRGDRHYNLVALSTCSSGTSTSVGTWMGDYTREDRMRCEPCDVRRCGLTSVTDRSRYCCDERKRQLTIIHHYLLCYSLTELLVQSSRKKVKCEFPRYFDGDVVPMVYV